MRSDISYSLGKPPIIVEALPKGTFQPSIGDSGT